MLDRYNVKELIGILIDDIEFFFWSSIILHGVTLFVLYVCIMHLKTCMKDHAQIYKAIMRISGDLPH